MLLGLLDELQIFVQLYQIELLGLLTGLGLLELWYLIYPRLLIGFDMLVFFMNVSLMEALFLFFSVIDSFEWFLMKSLHRNIQLILELLKAPFLVLHFFCYTLMTVLTMLSAILLSMLMILVSLLSVFRHLICGKICKNFWENINNVEHCLAGVAHLFFFERQAFYLIFTKYTKEISLT